MPLLLDKQIATRRPTVVTGTAPAGARGAGCRAGPPPQSARCVRWNGSTCCGPPAPCRASATGSSSWPSRSWRPGYPTNPASIAGVLAASRLPWLLLSLLGGVLADRVDRRNLLVATERGSG